MDNFAVLILTNGRPNKVDTVKTLRRDGYTGKIYLVIDDLDSTGPEYKRIYGDSVVVFDKKAAAARTDSADNAGSLRGVVYARNAAFDIARSLGLKYFLELDDDYTSYQYRFDDTLTYKPKSLKNLDRVFEAILDFLIKSGAKSVAMAQGGDFIGGENAAMAKSVTLKRKLMNSFFCSVDRPFSFLGRINEDTTLYVDDGSRGGLYFTLNQVNLNQAQTQANAGGLTEIYLDSGTYVKSFYTVLYQPSSVKVRMMATKYGRLHHSVSWKNTVPVIIREEYKKKD